MKLRSRERKYILRRALCGSVPSEILQKPKHGFDAIPMGKWMCHELESLVQEFLAPAELKRQGIYDPNLVELLLRQHKQGGRFNHWWKLWLLMALQMWLRSKPAKMAKRDIRLDVPGITPICRPVLGAP